MAKHKQERIDKTGWTVVNRLLYNFIEATRYPELPAKPKIGKSYEYWPNGTVCGNGNPYHGCIRMGSENKLMIVFSGGGVSIDEYTAARPSKNGSTEQSFYAENVVFADILLKIGTYGKSKKNPFRNWNVLLVPYATGDFHCGTNDFPYTDLSGKSATLYHHGYTNYRALLKKMKELVPNPEQFIVTGFSAGAFGTSLLTDDIASEFPNCRDVTAIVDSAIMLNDWQRIAREVWKAPEEIAQRLTGDEIVSDNLLALHAKRPDVKIMYLCSKRDFALTQWVGYLEENGNWHPTEKTGDLFQKHLRETVARLEAEIPNLAVFIFDTPDKKYEAEKLTAHCLCGSRAAFTVEAGGVTCAEWMKKGVNGDMLKLGMEKLL